jgi:hypothetical protein
MPATTNIEIAANQQQCVVDVRHDARPTRLQQCGISQHPEAAQQEQDQRQMNGGDMQRAKQGIFHGEAEGKRGESKQKILTCLRILFSK